MTAKAFIDALQKLRLSRPRIALMASASENSDYTNYAYRNKNCYLVFGSHYNEDCFYGQYIYANRDCIDCDRVNESELCYECTVGGKIYNGNFLTNCYSSSDCEYGFDLVNCRDCFLCAGLRNAQYCIRNQAFSKEQFHQEVEKIKQKYSPQELLQELDDVKKTVPHASFIQRNCENCIGSFLENSRNCYACFSGANMEDCMYMQTTAHHTKDCLDCDSIGYDPSELLYECIGISGSTNCNFCYSSWHNSDLEYCELVFNSKHCFGCIGRSHAEYEILNQKYSKDDYFQKVAFIKDELKRDGFYGRWLLPSTYPYEDSIAPQYYS
ncbi:MAG: hypothetical protein AAB588_00780 [Patescibacteria group bacterium]